MFKTSLSKASFPKVDLTCTGRFPFTCPGTSNIKKKKHKTIILMFFQPLFPLNKPVLVTPGKKPPKYMQLRVHQIDCAYKRRFHRQNHNFK